MVHLKRGLKKSYVILIVTRHFIWWDKTIVSCLFDILKLVPLLEASPPKLDIGKKYIDWKVLYSTYFLFAFSTLNSLATF